MGNTSGAFSVVCRYKGQDFSLHLILHVIIITYEEIMKLGFFVGLMGEWSFVSAIKTEFDL